MTGYTRLFIESLAACPIVAILRGITPVEAPAIGELLVTSGFTILEVPLNSPSACESITRLSESLGKRALVGAGTVLTVEQVDAVARAGGQLVVSPNSKPAVIEATVAAGLVSLPGYFTTTEAFAALEAGAHALKFFPADAIDPVTLKAQRAVLPDDVSILPVGGISPENMAGWLAAGANGFGIGSNLYRPGKPATEVVRDAKRLIRALAQVGSGIELAP